MSRDDAPWSERDEFAALLAAEQAVEPPPGSDHRVRERVMASVALGVPTPPEGPPLEGAQLEGAASPVEGGGAGGGISSGGVASTGSAAGAAGVSTSVAVGGGGLALVVGGATLGALALGAWLALAPASPDPTSAPTPAPALPAPRAPAPPAPATATRSTASSPSAPRPPDPVRPAPAPTARRAAPAARPEARPAARPAARPDPRPASPTTPAVDDALRGELELLAEARDALSADAPDRALSAVAAHARRHPRGRFDQEREVLAIRALVAAGRPDDARARAARFHRRFPGSLHRAAVDALIPPAP